MNRGKFKIPTLKKIDDDIFSQTVNLNDDTYLNVSFKVITIIKIGFVTWSVGTA